MLAFIPIGQLIGVFEIPRPGLSLNAAAPLYLWGRSLAIRICRRRVRVDHCDETIARDAARAAYSVRDRFRRAVRADGAWTAAHVDGSGWDRRLDRRRHRSGSDVHKGPNCRPWRGLGLQNANIWVPLLL
jgi:hypothetical protein